MNIILPEEQLRALAEKWRSRNKSNGNVAEHRESKRCADELTAILASAKRVEVEETVLRFHELAFEYGDTDENGTGYDFSMEQFDEFARAALKTALGQGEGE